MQAVGLPVGGTRYLWDVGTATDTLLWIRVPDLHYAAVSPFLSAAELATVTSTLPPGWTKSSTVSILQPNPRRKTIVKRSDSIGAGTLTTTGDTRDTWLGQAIALIEPITWLDGNYSEGVTDNYQILNMNLGSSSWDNSVALGLETLIKRTNGATLNGVLDGYNIRLRVNAATMGYELFDTEALAPPFNIVTGDTTNATYYNPDGIHPKTAGNALAAAAHKDYLIACLAAP